MGALFSRWTRQTIRIHARQYEVVRRLGSGGFADVDLVRDPGSGAEFALKRIRCAEDDIALRRATREMERHGLFDSEYVAKCLDFEWHPQSLELVALFPLYPNGTLQAKVDAMRARQARFEERELLHLFKQICLGVRVLHSSTPPMAHRDLKLGNVMLTADNKPVLIDLGSADVARVPLVTRKDVTALQELAAEHCSMPCRAPELYDCGTLLEVTEKTDIWSLGCILYSLAYLITPFERMALKGGSLPLAIAQGKFDFPTSNGGDIYSANVHDIIKQLLQVDPDARPDIHTLLMHAALN